MTIKLLGRKYLLSYLDKKYLVNRTVKYFCCTRSLVEKTITETLQMQEKEQVWKPLS